MAWSKDMKWSKFYEILDGFTELYLRKLGLTYKEPSRDYLDELICAHLQSIPFENLSVTDFDEPVSLEPEALMHKLLLCKRGGFCFELNGAFMLLLNALGFNAWLCSCRQLLHNEPVPVPATHCAVLIYFKGNVCFADVGYGGAMPRGSLDLITSKGQNSNGGIYCFEPSSLNAFGKSSPIGDSLWLTLSRTSMRTKEKVNLAQILPAPKYLCDFYGESLLRSVGPSRFDERHISICYPDGYADMKGDVLHIVHGDNDTTIDISETNFRSILKEYFNIEVS